MAKYSSRKASLGKIRKMIGKSSFLARDFKIEKTMVEHYAETLRLEFERSEIVPPTFLTDYSWGQGNLNERGHFSNDLDPLFPNKTMIRAGNNYEFLRDISVDEKITVKRTITNAFTKLGKKKKRLTFVISQLEYYDSQKKKIATNVETLVFL